MCRRGVHVYDTVVKDRPGSRQPSASHELYTSTASTSGRLGIGNNQCLCVNSGLGPVCRHCGGDNRPALAMVGEENVLYVLRTSVR